MSPAWSPDGNWIAYISDTDGNEQWDIFLVSPKTGEVVNLTTTKEISEESPVWSPDSKQIAYIVKPKDRLQLRDRPDGRLLPPRAASHPEHARELVELRARASAVMASPSSSPRSDADFKDANVFLRRPRQRQEPQPHSARGRQTLLRLGPLARRQRPCSSPPTRTTAT